MATSITVLITNNDPVNVLQYQVSSKSANSVDGRITNVTIGTVAVSPGNVSLTLDSDDELSFGNAVRPRNKYPT